MIFVITVIGRKVNMAARLMTAYSGIVTCDNETYHHSKLPKAHFHMLEIKTMKGLQNIGTIREYKETKGSVHIWYKINIVYKINIKAKKSTDSTQRIGVWVDLIWVLFNSTCR